MTTTIFGMLEVDSERGIVYFHASPQAQDAGFSPTPLRICGLGKITFPFNGRQIDVTIRPNNHLNDDDELVAMVSK